MKTVYSGQLLSVGISTSPEYFKPDLLDLGTFNMVWLPAQRHRCENFKQPSKPFYHDETMT